jgi:pimeloyl-ACP methyl ester carboxylesterase
MVPGAYFRQGDFAEHGFVDALDRHHAAVDAIAAAPSPARYLDGDIAAFLHDTYVAPALAAGQRRIWMLGISLGALGALMHAQAYPGVVEGLILLAPFLGTQGLIAEATNSGGLRHWHPECIRDSDRDRRMLAGLANGFSPKIYLGYGLSDRYAPASILLADLLPPGRVVRLAGGHDWPTWISLWSHILDLAPFEAHAASERRCLG